jgi:hypothetical protein
VARARVGAKSRTWSLLDDTSENVTSRRVDWSISYITHREPMEQLGVINLGEKTEKITVGENMVKSWRK